MPAGWSARRQNGMRISRHQSCQSLTIGSNQRISNALRPARRRKPASPPQRWWRTCTCESPLPSPGPRSRGFCASWRVAESLRIADHFDGASYVGTDQILVEEKGRAEDSGGIVDRVVGKHGRALDGCGSLSFLRLIAGSHTWALHPAGIDVWNFQVKAILSDPLFNIFPETLVKDAERVDIRDCAKGSEGMKKPHSRNFANGVQGGGEGN